MEPRGPAAERIAFLWWFMLVVGGLIWLGVMSLLGLGLWRQRQTGTLAGDELPPVRADEPSDLPSRPSTWIVGGGIIMPVIVLITTYLLTLGSLRAIANEEPDTLVIEVIGHQWWWEVRYPQQDFVTANEIHIPAGQAVSLRLTSADVIHSFWVPELHGKLDLNPGMTNTLILTADSPGIFRGQCAEFCGVQHAKMGLLVIADEPAEFEAWLANQQMAALVPTAEAAEAGRQVFLNSPCVYCHTVRGTGASGNLGPDLTHLASRRTLAANTILNTRGHLAGWIVDSQGIKPGNKMPPIDLNPNDLQALLAYLESLE